uniref:NADH-ubiquinone oxidoreductase chain 4L n=1 Tax=Brachystomella parvula TaxID=187611 RepID=A0A650BK43_9HEXA|nr:NADH dehydrogenase subunit 4L [Brachystomella parvula]
MLMMILLCFTFGFVSFSMKINHILKMLLMMEFMVLMIFFSLLLTFDKDSLYLSLLFLIFSVCEGALGLTVLVCVTRAYGGDYSPMLSLSY